MKRFFRRLLGYHDCGVCEQQTAKLVKDYLLHPDEPMLFAHWQCFNPECLASSEVDSLPWADKIANGHGYRTFKVAMEAALARAKLRHGL